MACAREHGARRESHHPSATPARRRPRRTARAAGQRAGCEATGGCAGAHARAPVARAPGDARGQSWTGARLSEIGTARARAPRCVVRMALRPRPHAAPRPQDVRQSLRASGGEPGRNSVIGRAGDDEPLGREDRRVAAPRYRLRTTSRGGHRGRSSVLRDTSSWLGASPPNPARLKGRLAVGPPPRLPLQGGLSGAHAPPMVRSAPSGSRSAQRCSCGRSVPVQPERRTPRVSRTFPQSRRGDSNP